MSKSFKETSGITINAKVYPLEVIESAAYVFIDKAYIILDGDPQNDVIVTIIPKKGHEKENLELEFHNELINYANYKNFADKNRELRIAILQRALVTNNPSLVGVKDKDEELDEETKKLLKELEDEEDDFLDDPEGIAIPWEEKYGKKNKKKAKDVKKRKNKAK